MSAPVMDPSPGPARWLDAELPSPYISGVFDLSRSETVYLNLSRGCTLSCQFCSIGIERAAYFSFDRVAAELDAVLAAAPKLRKINCVGFDVFDHPHSEAILRRLREISDETGVLFRFDTNIRKLSDPAKARRLDCAGFHVDTGIQSTLPEALKRSGRPKDVQQIIDAIAVCRREAPRANLILGFIRGLPGDTLEGFLHTLDWGLSTGYSVKVNHLRVLPGTGFADDPLTHGLIVEEDFPYFARGCDGFPEDKMEESVALTNRLGFIWRVMTVDPFVRRAVIDAGAALGGRPYPTIDAALELTGALRASGRFSRNFENYQASRLETPDGKSREFEIEEVVAEPFDRLALLEESAAFRRRVTGSPWPEAEARLALSREARGWNEFGAFMRPAARRLLGAACGGAPGEEDLLICSDRSRDESDWPGSLLRVRDEYAGMEQLASPGAVIRGRVLPEELHASRALSGGTRWRSVTLSGLSGAFGAERAAAAVSRAAACLRPGGWIFAAERAVHAQGVLDSLRSRGIRPVGAPAQIGGDAVLLAGRAG